MGRFIEDSVVFLKELYPELKIITTDYGLEVSGRLVIEAIYKGHEINIAPKVLLQISSIYPKIFPRAYELEQEYSSDHLLDNGALCVGSPFDLMVELSNSSHISDYFHKFLIPYFLSIYFHKTTGKYIFGERKHGAAGIYDSIADFFGIHSKEIQLTKKLFKCAARKGKLHRIAPSNASVLSRQYGDKIATLRAVDLDGLRNLYQHLEIMKDAEKMYFNYLESQRYS